MKQKFICPKCGNELNFYTKERYSGTCNCYFRTDGKIPENGEMHAYANHKYTSKFVFCTDCDSKVGKISELFSEWE